MKPQKLIVLPALLAAASLLSACQPLAYGGGPGYEQPPVTQVINNNSSSSSSSSNVTPPPPPPGPPHPAAVKAAEAVAIKKAVDAHDNKQGQIARQ